MTKHARPHMQWTFHLETSTFDYLSALMVYIQWTQRKHLPACILHTATLNTDSNSCPPAVKPRPMKTINWRVAFIPFRASDCVGTIQGWLVLFKVQQLGLVDNRTRQTQLLLLRANSQLPWSPITPQPGSECSYSSPTCTSSELWLIRCVKTFT